MVSFVRVLVALPRLDDICALNVFEDVVHEHIGSQVIYLHENRHPSIVLTYGK